MAGIETFRVNEKWDVDVVIYFDCCYVLADNRLLTTRQWASWCRNCQTVVAAECIQTVAEIDEELRQLSDPSDKIHKCFSRRTIEEWLQEDRVRLEWLRTRKAPARCLECEKTDVVHIDSSDFVDAVSGTRIKNISTGHASMVHEIRRRLTSEGMLIEVH